MSQNEGDGIRSFPVFVNKMNSNPIYLSSKICKGVNGLFLRAPIKGGTPICNQFLHIGKVCPIVPASIINFIRPPRTLKPVL